MKYLLVQEIGVPASDRWIGAGYPGDGVYVTQYDRDPVCVVAGRVWRLPAGSHELVVETTAAEPPSETGEWVNFKPSGPLVVAPGSLMPVQPDALALRRWAMERAQGMVASSGVSVTDYTKCAEEILAWVLQTG